ncbi:MAG: adenosylmethionine decarboxylase [Ichthyobacteriaceae bacterium]|nr:adenosylmethionine decarboxylase [Ichthyobacteriaceae bacterium]
MQSLGEHILIELYGCDINLIDDTEKLESVMLESAKIANATVVKSVFHKFAPQGVTGVIVVEESHFAIHTWPEHGYAAVDLFTCSEVMDYNAAYLFLVEKLEAKKHEFKKVLRGEKVMAITE